MNELGLKFHVIEMDNLLTCIGGLLSNSAQMTCGTNASVQRLQEEVDGYSVQIQELTARLLEQGEELSWMRKEVKLVLSELSQTKQFLKDIADEMQVVQN